MRPAGRVARPAKIMPNHTTISQLARRFGLSRSTLLYYDRIGLLRASERTVAGYRRYQAREERRLRRICELRKAGLGLGDIRVMLGGAPDVRTGVIERRLAEIARQIVSLRDQQRLLAALHRHLSEKPLPPILDKKAWVEMLRLAGMDERAMSLWHAEFERRAPEEHEQFLASLGIPPDEIAGIRRWSRTAGI
jgi:MerR family transcriptional regulator, thiopeptide resistance regulator